MTPFIRAEGDPAMVGLQHGSALAGPLRFFLDDGLGRLNRVLETATTLEELRPTIDAYRAEVDRSTPLVAEEVAGLAAGAGICLDEAWLLQLRREIMGYRRIPTAGDCTTYAWAGGDPVLAQTVDLNGDLDDQIAVLEVNRRTLVLSFAGLLGYLGLNRDGLAIGINLVLGGEWRPGLPPYLAIRYLLDTVSAVDEAVEALRGLRLASSRCLTLCDRTKVAYVEILGDELRVVEVARTVHTNHFLHPDLATRDELNVFARNSSVRRLRACQDALCTPPADVDEHFALLSQPPICVPNEGDVRRERTVAAVVMLPAHGEMYVRPGDPARSATEVFRLSGEDVTR